MSIHDPNGMAAVAPSWLSDPQWSMSERSGHPTLLLAIGHLLRREVELDVLFAAIVDQVAKALEADRGTLYLVDPEAGELFSRAAHLPELKQIRLKLGQGVAGSVATSGELVNLPTVPGERSFFADIDRQTGYKTRSILAAPILDRHGKTLGVLQVLNAKSGRFSTEAEGVMRRLAAETAMALEATSLYSQVRAPAETALPVRYRYNRIVGESREMRAVYDLVRRAAATTATVLITGESGTGKELLARAVHFNSPRKDAPFVKLDCTAIPPTLIENELFGHERGAFTGADRRSEGKCEQAGGGTLFIDEIGELPLPVQSKLLRFLQDREFERVGGTRTLRTDARVVVATHRDLLAMVARGQFREDLYYRCRVVELRLPPLRQRGREDIVRLAEHFLDQYSRRYGDRKLRLSAPAIKQLVEHHWPGNIRELEHCIESAVVLVEGELIEPRHLPMARSQPSPAPPRPETWSPRTLDEVEQEHIARTLAAHGGNRSLAARSLGIGRNTLLRKITRYGL